MSAAFRPAFGLPSFARSLGIHEVSTPYEIQRQIPVPWHLVLFTFAGQGQYWCGGKSEIIEPNSVWIVPAHTPHRYTAIGSWKMISMALISSERRDHFKRGVSIYKSCTHDVNHLLSAVEVYLSETTHSQDDASSTAQAIAEYICAFAERELAPEQPHEVSQNRLNLHKLWETVNATPGAPWAIAELSEQMCVSVRQFQRLMQKHYGITAEA